MKYVVLSLGWYTESIDLKLFREQIQQIQKAKVLDLLIKDPMDKVYKRLNLLKMFKCTSRGAIPYMFYVTCPLIW